MSDRDIALDCFGAVTKATSATAKNEWTRDFVSRGSRHFS